LNQDLIKGLFAACDQLPSLTSIQISHKTKGSFHSWNMSSLCSESAWKYCHSVVFDRELYPGYQNKKVLTAKGGFPTFDAKVYVYTKEIKEKVETSRF